ncbi:hypothetical protein GC197_02520 [bacterium]|nr:hypothetical protein [bacterium]
MRNLRMAFALAVSLAISATANGEDSGAHVPTLEIALLDSGKLQRIDVEVECFGQSYSQHWKQKFLAIFQYCDTDQNGVLSTAEAKRLPSTRALREATFSGFAPLIGTAPSFTSVDQDRNGEVMADEIESYYRRQGIGLPTVCIGRAPFTDKLTASLLSQLDLNEDGQVDLAEWQEAESILDRLDQNDDQLVGAGELVDDIFYPGTSGNELLEIQRDKTSRLPNSLANFAMALLPREQEDFVWTQRLMKQNGFPESLADLASIQKWRQEPPVDQWFLNIKQADTDPTMAISGVGSGAESTGIRGLKLEGRWITVRTDPGQSEAFINNLCQFTLESFQKADANHDGQLTPEECSEAKRTLGPAMVEMCDRDENQLLTELEVNAWLDLQKQIGTGLVLITAIDCGQGLFELLDTDRNGALSRRELANASSRLQESGCIHGDRVELNNLPQQFLVTVSLGRPTSPIGSVERKGPDWFLLMDRNQDGHVSVTEFVGGPEAFRSLDRDGDQRITVNEVENLSQQ